MLCVKEGFKPGLPIRTFCGLELSTIGNRFSHKLTATPSIHKTQLAHLGETDAQVQVRSEVEHIAGGINHIVAALIGQYRMLRLERHTCAQLILLADKAQRHGCIVIVVSVFRILTQAIHRMLFVSGRQRPLTIPNPESPANHTSSCRSRYTCTGTDS